MLAVVFQAIALAVTSGAASNSKEQTAHWAFQPLRKLSLPEIKNRDWPRTVIDRFIIAKLEGQRIEPTALAEKHALIRRATFDLTGLPPAQDDVEEFVSDSSPEAFDRVLNRLLDSPHFGECWGRHWLDWAGYVDVLGGDNDAGTVKLGAGKWRYRDYVIDCFNHDRPFDRFIREQLAGDEMVDWRKAEKFTPEIVELLTASTFLRSAADDTDENELNTLDIRHGVLQRTMEVVANNLLALTVNCAKCHDHKYDPIPQRDYYQFEAFFTPAFNPDTWLQPKDRALADLSNRDKEEIDRHNKAVDETVSALKKRRDEIESAAKEKLFEEKLTKLPEAIREDTKIAVCTPAEKRTEVQKYLTRKFEKEIIPKPEEIAAALGAQGKATVALFDDQIKELNGKRKTWGMIQAVYDSGAPPPTHLLKRGNYLTPGEEVQPVFLSALRERTSLNGLKSGSLQPCGATTGRRLALANWLTDTNSTASALMARVIMNRVWQQLFGVAIVETSDNFGLAGARPTHPELLDWLASEYIRQGWRLKPMLRLMMRSAVYQQSSATPETAAIAEAARADPENRLLWHQRLRRLDSEAVRDALLAVSGKLDGTMKGPPVPTENRPDGMVVVNEKQCSSPTSKWRRSIYLLARRNYQLSLLSTFDQPTMAQNCTRRSPSAVVLQSLMMLNDSFVIEHANFVAERVRGQSGEMNCEKEVKRAFKLVLSRPPDSEEIEWCVDFIQRQTKHHQSTNIDGKTAQQKALANLCHMLLNSSEFLYLP
jgi:hypothetical protein